MAPPRRFESELGRALRAARLALSASNWADLRATRVPVSTRQVSRWENGFPPNEADALRLSTVLAAVPAPIRATLLDALGLEVLAAPSVALVPPPPAGVAPPPPPSPRPTAAQLRAQLDAVIYATAESRDVLPRHLRAPSPSSSFRKPPGSASSHKRPRSSSRCRSARRPRRTGGAARLRALPLSAPRARRSRPPTTSPSSRSSRLASASRPRSL